MGDILVAVFISAVVLAIIYFWLTDRHHHEGLPYTKRRAYFKRQDRIRELEWDLNIGGVRSWAVKKRWDGKWEAKGYHHYLRDTFSTYVYGSYSDALRQANRGARRNARVEVPREGRRSQEELEMRW